jgi:hypothetical protein
MNDRILLFIIIGFSLIGIAASPIDLLMTKSLDDTSDLSTVWQKDLGIAAAWLKSYSLEEYNLQTDSEIFILRSKGRHLRIEKIMGIDEASARILSEDEIFSIKALYANILSPYPGEVSHQIVCNPQYQPQYFSYQNEQMRWEYVFLYSTDRFGLGACHEDILGYRHIIAWILCREKETLYIVRYYAPVTSSFEEMEKEILSLRCSVANGKFHGRLFKDHSA